MLESENPIPAFLATDDYVPGAFRDLLSEADGCMQKGFLTGGTACARRALDLLLNVAKTEGASYEDRLQSLGEKHGIAKMLTSILVQCGGASAKDNATLSADVLQLFIVTMKAVVYELYVVGPERTGTPEQYATLVALLARHLGVAARVVSGFRVLAPGGGTLLPSGTYSVSTAQAWTWVEVPVVGAGWVVLDAAPSTYSSARPTPSVAASQSPSPTATPTQNALVTKSPGGHAIAPKSTVPSASSSSSSFATST